MENRIKEAQLDLLADRLSSATFRANQLRLWFASAAYVLMHTLRRVGLKNTAMARACANTIRLRAKRRITVPEKRGLSKPEPAETNRIHLRALNADQLQTITGREKSGLTGWQRTWRQLTRRSFPRGSHRWRDCVPIFWHS